MITVNGNTSVTGEEILEWVDSPDLEDIDLLVARKIKHRYIEDRYGHKLNRIHPQTSYFVRYNDHSDSAYIIRDKLVSPKQIPGWMRDLDLTSEEQSYKGGIISEWAYYHNAQADSPFQENAHDIVINYLETDRSLKDHVFYFLSVTPKGVKVFRDLEKSPRVSYD